MWGLYVLAFLAIVTIIADIFVLVSWIRFKESRTRIFNYLCLIIICDIISSINNAAAASVQSDNACIIQEGF